MEVLRAGRDSKVGSRWGLVALEKVQASFVASENRTDIALDDPNFWQKWAKKADLDLELLNSKVSSPGQNTLVIDTPRVRKQTRHFSTLRDDDLVEFSDLDSDEEPERPERAGTRSRRGHHGGHHRGHHGGQQQQQQQVTTAPPPAAPATPPQPFGRSECLRVERHLMVFG
ncbi:hypothetical protein HGM15179_021128, partial [Zosterops borbonicus]